MTDTVAVALIAAVPSTLAAVGAIWQSRRTNRRVQHVQEQTEHVVHETSPNSGRSMFDRVARTEGKVDALTEVVGQLVERLDRHIDGR